MIFKIARKRKFQAVSSHRPTVNKLPDMKARTYHCCFSKSFAAFSRTIRSSLGVSPPAHSLRTRFHIEPTHRVPHKRTRLLSNSDKNQNHHFRDKGALSQCSYIFSKPPHFPIQRSEIPQYILLHKFLSFNG